MVCAFEQRRSAFTSSAAGSRQVKMETTTGNSAERLWADDENAKARILEIDLSAYDELITYPVEVDWPRERRKIIFLQTALRLAIPWNLIVQFTSPYLGQTLWAPFVPVVTPIVPASFMLPAFDIARQSVGQWAEMADNAWKAYRAYIACELSESRQQLIQSGKLKEFDWPRETTAIAGQVKAQIADEKTAYLWAVEYYFAAQIGNPIKWATIAAEELQIRKFKGSPTERAKLKRKIAEQVRTNVIKVLRALGLPEQPNPSYSGS